MAILPNTGITISAVGNALGTTARDLGTLCTHSSINKWAMNKPFIYPTTSPVTAGNRQSKNYGLDVVSATTVTSATYGLIAQVDANLGMGVVYNKPSGGSTQPYRLGDFRGYLHDAVEPVTHHFKTTREVADENYYDMSTTISSYTSSSWSSISPMMPDDRGTQGQLYVDDVYPDGKNLNWGCAISSSTAVRWSVGGIPWNDSRWQSAFSGKTCKVYEFLTNLASGRTSLDGTIISTDDRFYALPRAKHTVYFKASSPTGTDQFSMGGSFKGSLGVVNGTLTVSSVGSNYTGATFYFMKAEIVLNSGDTQNIGEKSIYASGATLADEATDTHNIKIIANVPDGKDIINYKVRVSYRTTKMSVSKTVMYSILSDISGGDLPKV